MFRESDGAFLGQRLSPRRREPADADWPSSPPRGSPLVEDGRLWYVDNRWEVVCLDLAPLKSGGAPVELWTTDLFGDVGARPTDLHMWMVGGCSIGPAVDGRLYVATGNGPRTPEGPALVCLDRDTGRVLGRERSGISARTVGRNWSSPVALPGIVLFGGGDGFLYAFDPVPAEGTLRERWKVDVNPDGRKEREGVFAAPVIHEGRVYVALGDDLDGDVGGNLCAVDLRTGRKLWEQPDAKASLGSPVVHGGRVYLGEVPGFVRAFEAESGRPLWTVDTLSTLGSSLMLAGGKLFVSTLDDEIRIVEGADPAKVLVRPMRGGLYATPILANGTLFIAAEGWLTAIRGREPVGERPSGGPRGRAADAPFVSTPMDVVGRMLDLARPRPDETLYDLGSGDGRILIEAARRFGCRAVGWEIDANLVAESRRRIAEAGLSDRVEVRHEDLMKADFSRAGVVTLYLGERICRELRPKLTALPKGARVVSHHFGIGTPPDRTERLESAETRREHVLHLWTAPLK
jgi:outer membrane protein assembly factor BamB